MNTMLVVPWDQTEGGVASVVGNLGSYLQQNGHKVIFFHPDDHAATVTMGRTKSGFDGLKLRFGGPLSIKNRAVRKLLFLGLIPITLYRLARTIRKYRIQIVNIHYPLDAFSFFALCRKVLPFKLVVSVHGADIFPKGGVQDRYSLALRFLMDSADLLIANSGAFRDDLLSVFPRLHEKTIFIHNGVDLAELDGPGRELARVGRARYVLCIAAHNEKKAIDVLIRAMVLLTDIQPPFKLVLAGDGPLRAELEALAASLAVQDRIEFLGHQGRPEIRALLRQCEVFVLPSRSEPFGVAIIEALAYKKPVVATAVGGIREIIEQKKSGILVEPDSPKALADGLRMVLTDSGLKKTLAQNGYARVTECFCFSHTGAAYEKAFTSLGPEEPRPTHVPNVAK
jgi:glycosyltransferase involved in cell wall biosynthesis